MIPPAEQSIVIQLVECFDTINQAEGDDIFGGSSFDSSTQTSSETDIISTQTVLKASSHRAYLSFHYRQPIISCTALILRAYSNISLNANASHHLWRSLTLFPELRYLIVDLSDVDAVAVLAEAHEELWKSLDKKLHYYHFAPQPEVGTVKEWVGHDPLSQTDR